MCSRGLSTLGGAFAVTISIAVDLTGSFSAPLVAQLALPPENPSVQQILPLLDRLIQEQQNLRETIARLEGTQETSFDRQHRLLQDQYGMLSRRLSADRQLQVESLHDLSQVALATTLAVAGVLLFAMGAVAWSLLHAFQRLPLRVRAVSQQFSGPNEVGLPFWTDRQLAGALAALEKRLLRLGETAAKAANVHALPPNRNPTGPGETPVALPGDFL